MRSIYQKVISYLFMCTQRALHTPVSWVDNFIKPKWVPSIRKRGTGWKGGVDVLYSFLTDDDDR